MRKPALPHEKISDLLSSIGNSARVQILMAIGVGEACVCHLESLLGLRQAHISQQLMLLRKKGIISSRRDGKYIYYRLENPAILEIVRIAGRLTGVADQDLVFQDHSNCECPRCNVEQSISVPDLVDNA